MATRVRKRPCCGRARKAAPTDFCGGLRISTGVTLVNEGAWSIKIQAGGKLQDIGLAISAYKCENNSAGVRLAQVAQYALGKVLSAGKADQLRYKAGRQMPLILLKDFLFKTAGVCRSCKGRGCGTCNNMGVA